MDVSPVVDLGRQAAKATVGEPMPVRASVFREGHDQLERRGGPDRPVRNAPRARADGQARRGPDRYDAWVTPDAEGSWTFEVVAWSDPLATWEHDAGLKIPAGVDVELMFTEGRLLLERVLAAGDLDTHDDVRGGRRRPGRRATPHARSRPASPPCRAPSCGARCATDPLRELVSTEGPYPLYADRTRALFGSWYEFFPRSEGATRTRRPAPSPPAPSAPPRSASTRWPRWAST